MPLSTKDRILDAAERLFAEKGYDAASLRGVTGEAGVNLASVGYHFGGKANLFRAVFERRVGGINAERLAMLDAAEGGDSPPTLEVVLEAFLAPALRLVARKDEGHERFMQLVGRTYASSGEHIEVLKSVFQEILARFFPALQRALPELAPADVFWRLHFMLGSMSVLLADPDRIRVLSNGTVTVEDPEEPLRQLVAFAAAGFRASAAGQGSTR
ncbi:MAG: TetR/AcrR family transcriptional regulator [Planctomycetota bacterium]|nr:MAG: TetR/AcrR family transcriptional regulator [Planctomycetota bacterium]